MQSHDLSVLDDLLWSYLHCLSCCQAVYGHELYNLKTLDEKVNRKYNESEFKYNCFWYILHGISDSLRLPGNSIECFYLRIRICFAPFEELVSPRLSQYQEYFSKILLTKQSLNYKTIAMFLLWDFAWEHRLSLHGQHSVLLPVSSVLSSELFLAGSSTCGHWA